MVILKLGDDLSVIYIIYRAFSVSAYFYNKLVHQIKLLQGGFNQCKIGERFACSLLDTKMIFLQHHKHDGRPHIFHLKSGFKICIFNLQ